MSAALALLITALSRFLTIYLVLLFIRILLSWFPNVDWSRQPFSIVSQLTDPYLNLFRSIIPPLGGIDFSPILAIFLLQFLQSGISQLSVALAASYFVV
ncbi:MAG: YggT family protein [Cyanothece sp. SIO1E1]|nr:YggT family protein [Cyanothece sp. SIO1E1]